MLDRRSARSSGLTTFVRRIITGLRDFCAYFGSWFNPRSISGKRRKFEHSLIVKIDKGVGAVQNSSYLRTSDSLTRLSSCFRCSSFPKGEEKGMVSYLRASQIERIVRPVMGGVEYAAGSFGVALGDVLARRRRLW